MHSRRSGFSPKFRTLVAPLLLVLAALSCRFSPQDQATAEPQGFLPLTAVASITPPPPPRQACPVEDMQPAAPDWQDPLQAARPLLTYLNDGGSPLAIEAPDGQVLELARPDLDGDGLVDLAFIIGQDSQSLIRSGAIFVFYCASDHFELIYTAAGDQDLSAPQIIASSDLNKDGKQDLLVAQQRCGAHTCTAQVQLLMLSNGEMSDRLEGSTVDLPSPNIQVLEDPELADRIMITATGINSVGAGPFRPYSRIWGWDQETRRYRPIGESQAEPVFRIHLLHDADQAVKQGEFANAQPAYMRVIEDENLAEWMMPESERQVLAAYARFRLVALAVQSGQVGDAQTQMDLLANQVEGSFGQPFFELAQAFWTTYQQTKDYAQACQSARAFGASHSKEVLDPLYFGYSNPSYSPDDLCPLPPYGDAD